MIKTNINLCITVQLYKETTYMLGYKYGTWKKTSHQLFPHLRIMHMNAKYVFQRNMRHAL